MFPRALCAAVTAVFVLAPVAAAYAGSPVAAPVAAPDTVGPDLAGLVVAPASVDVSGAAAVVAVSAHLADVSGVASASVALGSGVSAPLSLTSGDFADGTWSGVITVPAFTPHGPVLAQVTTTDDLGNAATRVAEGALTVLDAAPAAPASVSAVAEGPGALRVSWTAPPGNGGSPVSGYDVAAEPPPGSDAVVPAALPVGAAADSVLLSGLTEGTRYVVRVIARNAAGPGAAAPTDAATAPVPLTVPDAPTSVAVTPDAAALHVTWTAPASDGGSAVTAYDVVAAPRTSGLSAPPVVTAAGSPVVVPGLVDGEAYDVRVVAVNGVGAGRAGTASGTPRSVPGAPLVGTVSAGDATALVRWTPPVSDGGAAVSSYAVRAAPSGAVVTVPATARSVSVTPLANGVATTFTVTAVNAAGPGLASAPSAGVVPRQPGRLKVETHPAAAVAYGTASTVDAALVVAGVGIVNQPVELMAQVRPSTTWKRVATGTTGTNGRVRLRATFPANTALKLHHPAGPVAAQDVAVRSVSVAPRLTRSVEAARIRLGRNVVVRGSVTPAQPKGAPVLLQRYVNGAWRTVASGRMNSSTGYGVSWRPAGTGAYTLRAVRPKTTTHAIGGSPQWRQQVVPETVTDVARDIAADRSIVLETTHESGVRDLATARQNLADLAAGRSARRSAYQNAPGGFTSVDIRLLRALRLMGVRGGVTVSEIAGGSHARGSTHYSGRGLDISWVNGRHVGPGSAYGLAVDACRANGAARIFHPGYDPYGGHASHVHCEWA
jgi:hypothetical protein